MNGATAMRMGAALALLLPMPAMAAGQVIDPAAPRSTPNTAAAPGTDTSARADWRAPLIDDDLAGNRGGETVVAGNQTLTAVTSGNTLNGNYVAGSVVLSGQALSNFNGIGNFAINTGAQVSIQSGMNLTINVAP